MNFLIVGLGNPGIKYKFTRHNIGFMVMDYLSNNLDFIFVVERYGLIATKRNKNKLVTYLKPSTYMNLSGKAYNYWIQKKKIDLKNSLVIVDDIALPFGKIRIKPKGNSGGHNGLKNIEEILKTKNFPRLRIGIGSNFSSGRQSNFVLEDFKKDEIERLPDILTTTKNIINAFICEGIHSTMNKYN